MSRKTCPRMTMLLLLGLLLRKSKAEEESIMLEATVEALLENYSAPAD